MQILANRYRILQEREIKQNRKEFERVFIEFGKDIETQLNKDDWITINYTNLINGLKRALINVFQRSSKKSIHWTRTLFGWKLENSDINAITDKALNEYNRKYAGDKIKGIGESTKSIINNIITNGQADGLTAKQIKDSIVNKVQEMSASRAMTIARTETSNAINITTHNTAEYSGMTKKTWIHIGGGKEDRAAHLAIDGKTMGIDEYFIVNGYQCLYPHDSNLPASEVINCYCICIYE